MAQAADHTVAIIVAVLMKIEGCMVAVIDIGGWIVVIQIVGCFVALIEIEGCLVALIVASLLPQYLIYQF